MSTLLQRLDAEIAVFTDNFANLVKASRVDTPDDNTTKVVWSHRLLSCTVCELSCCTAKELLGYAWRPLFRVDHSTQTVCCAKG